MSVCLSCPELKMTELSVCLSFFGHANITDASRMNKGLIVFLTEELLVSDFIACDVTVGGEFL